MGNDLGGEYEGPSGLSGKPTFGSTGSVKGTTGTGKEDANHSALF